MQNRAFYMLLHIILINLNQNKMVKEFVPYELALRMKALGFDGPCLAWYYGRDLWMVDQKESEPINYRKNPIRAGNGILAPTWQSAFAWFRDEHALFGKLEVLNFGADEYCYEVYDLYNEKTIYDNFQGAASSYAGTFDTYEEAELACLEKLIEIVETKSE